MEELRRLNFPVKSVLRLNNKNKTPTPLMALQLENNPLSQDIFKLKKLLNCIIITEPRRKSKDPPQCTNCQRYGHIHKSCKLQPRCVKCNEPHHYSNCEKSSNTPPTCVNCNETHPANYKGCAYFKTIKSKNPNNSQKYPQTESQPITNPARNDKAINSTTRTPNPTSYADITKGKINSTNLFYSEQLPKVPLNDNLQKTIIEFIENILQNIQNIISSIFNSITNNLSLQNLNVFRIGTQLSQPQKIQAGVPQGSVLGPTLLNIYCHDITTPPNSQLTMFADDTTIITQSNSLESSIQNLQTALNTVTSWFKTWKLNLNTTKSAAKIFSLKRYKDPQLVYIDNQPIQWNKKDDSVKYLGVFLDEKLTWKIHINKKFTQGYARMNTLYPLVNLKSTLHMKSSIILYTSIIRPLVTYACPTWAAAYPTKIKKIQILQNKFLRICLKAPWFMRNKQIHNDTGIPLLQDWIKIQYKNFHANLKTSDGARFYNLRTKTKNRRLKPRLPQDVLLSQSSEDEDQI
ncbi:hypothetical protein QTP88_017608 [Uroleucon formosanum]